MSVVIQADGIGKKYVISHRAQAYSSTLRDAFTESLSRVAQRFTAKSSRAALYSAEDVWALRDVSFEIRDGDKVGIIGRNGAGKSTLLKILSMVTHPTTGRVRLIGRIGSLLEVGTGFHPELTGRENIYLNGAVLGMTKQEIKSKFDEIVAFAEIERYLDTPVKRYSSGMYVRLAFAVAAHLDPEVLIIDEVLSVGDMQFQKKCIDKMREQGTQGRTILFVSHNLHAVRQLCTRGMVLDRGTLSFDGQAESAVDHYIGSFTKADPSSDLGLLVQNAPPDPAFRFTEVRLLQDGSAFSVAASGKPLEIVTEYDVYERTRGLRICIDLCDMNDNLLVRSFHDEDNDGIPVVDPGHYKSVAHLPANVLGPISYYLIIRATIYNVRYCNGPDGFRILIPVENTSNYNRAYPGEPFRGKLAVPVVWQTQSSL
jgi:lipopolysaccharide transport system ATP-binding protein